MNGQIRNQPNLIPLFFYTDYKNRYKRRHIDASKPLTLAQSQSLDPLYSEDVADIHKEDRRVSDAPLTRMEANLLKDAFEEILGSSQTQNGDQVPHTLATSVRAWRS